MKYRLPSQSYGLLILKRISGLMIIALLMSACDAGPASTNGDKTSAGSNKSPVLSLPQAAGNPRLKKQSGKTLFTFSEKVPVPLVSGEKKTLSVLFSPVYEPVSSIQITLKFDPEQLLVTDLKAAEGIMPFFQEINNEKGEIIMVAGVKGGHYGNALPAFTFTVEAQKGAQLAETSITFVSQDLSALLPDIANTETAEKENLPRLIFSLH